METINSLPFNANPQPGIAGSDKLHALFTGLMAGEQYEFYTNSLICEQKHGNTSNFPTRSAANTSHLGKR
ncbi:hypothetical protein [Bacteroides heparinolyticus]|uniref:hypothetical protein n=1 Tax=Prevotella heparinolytica TaxID=28113 RepID=UPI0023F047C1|nr:hypothetical protein [Bacteroides heparinolyticus]